MDIRTLACVALAGLTMAACDSSQTLTPADEEALALSLAAEAQQTFDAAEVGLEQLVGRLLRAVRQQGDETALAMLAEARALRHAARAAREEGDLETAKALARESHELLLGAIVLTLPEAPARVGAAVDRVRTRITQRVGDREAPRIRRVLNRVAELRDAADAALAAGDPVTALDRNLRAARMLVRLMHHLRQGLDEGEPAMSVLDIGF